MKILTDDFNHRIYEVGIVERGVFPDVDPNTELYKVTNEKGNFYAVAHGFSAHEVNEEDLPENYQEYCYEEDKGLYEAPPAPLTPEEQKIAELQSTIDMLTDCILEMADIVYA